MAYQFAVCNPLAPEIRRVARERVDAAIDDLEQPPAALHEGIHEARKRLKEIRALLRLVRSGSMRRTAALENRWYRELAHRLAVARDAAALVEAWDGLAEGDAEAFTSAPFDAVRQWLVARADAALRDGELDGAVRERIVGELHGARHRVADWPLGHGGFDVAAEGLRRSYRRGRVAMREARRLGDADALHAWRRRVKDQWYHTQLLQAAWPRALKARRKALKRLSDALGDDHDLAVLEGLMAADPARFGDAVDRDWLSRRILARRQHLQQTAHHLGGRLYAEKPGPFLRRMSAYWRVSHRAGQA